MSTRLDLFREHCAQMSTAKHKPECPSLTAKRPFWQAWAMAPDGMSMHWMGPPPPWEPPKCDGCLSDDQRALFARLAAEVDRYQQGELFEEMA